MIGRFALMCVWSLCAFAVPVAAQDEALADEVFRDPVVGASFPIPAGYRVALRVVDDFTRRYDLVPLDRPEGWEDETVYRDRVIWVSQRMTGTLAQHTTAVEQVTRGVKERLEMDFTGIEPRSIEDDLQHTEAGEPMGRIVYSAREPDFLETGIVFVRVGARHNVAVEFYAKVDMNAPSQLAWSQADLRMARELAESLRFPAYTVMPSPAPQTQPGNQPVVADPAEAHADEAGTEDSSEHLAEKDPAHETHDAEHSGRLSPMELLLLVLWAGLLAVIGYWGWLAKPAGDETTPVVD